MDRGSKQFDEKDVWESPGFEMLSGMACCGHQCESVGESEDSEDTNSWGLVSTQRQQTEFLYFCLEKISDTLNSQKKSINIKAGYRSLLCDIASRVAQRILLQSVLLSILLNRLISSA